MQILDWQQAALVHHQFVARYKCATNDARMSAAIRAGTGRLVCTGFVSAHDQFIVPARKNLCRSHRCREGTLKRTSSVRRQRKLLFRAATSSRIAACQERARPKARSIHLLLGLSQTNSNAMVKPLSPFVVADWRITTSFANGSRLPCRACSSHWSCDSHV